MNRSFKFATKLLMFLFLIFQSFTPALGEIITGQISNSGTPEQRVTSIASLSSKSKINICKDGRKNEITQLSGSILNITGERQKGKFAKDDCFYATQFEILEIVKGRPAIVGTLKQISKNEYAIINKDQKKWLLSKIPPGLKDLLNQEVICDLVANDATRGETTWLVARAFAMPKP